MSELKPNETDVCCECGSTNLDYEELHAEVPDKKGYARLEQEVCYCCDCFAIQSEDAQSAEIERLKADNARMRGALEIISKGMASISNEVNSRNLINFIKLAKQALKGEG